MGKKNPIKKVVNSITGQDKAQDEAKRLRKAQEKANADAQAERVKQADLEKQKAIAEERVKSQTAETNKYQDSLAEGQQKEASKGTIAPKGAGEKMGTEWLEQKEDETEVFEDFFF